MKNLSFFCEGSIQIFGYPEIRRLDDCRLLLSVNSHLFDTKKIDANVSKNHINNMGDYG